MRGFSRRVNRLATGPSCSPRRSPRRSPPRFPTAAASARFRRSSRTRRPPRTPPHPRRTPSGRLAHPRVVLGAHHAVHLHGAATGAHEAQCGSQLVTGRVAVVGARPGVLPLGHDAGLRFDPVGGGEFGAAPGGGGPAEAQKPWRGRGSGRGLGSGRGRGGGTGRGGGRRSLVVDPPGRAYGLGAPVTDGSCGGHGQWQGDREHHEARQRHQANPLVVRPGT